jgi:GxxExxY protein
MMVTERQDNGDVLTGRIIKAAYMVAREIGRGLSEAIYQRAMTLELGEAGLQIDREVKYPVIFKGRQIGLYVADLIVERMVIVELKVYDGPIQPIHLAQCLNYMRLSTIPTGLVINFGRSRIESKRLIL